VEFAGRKPLIQGSIQHRWNKQQNDTPDHTDHISGSWLEDANAEIGPEMERQEAINQRREARRLRWAKLLEVANAKAAGEASRIGLTKGDLVQKRTAKPSDGWASVPFLTGGETAVRAVHDIAVVALSPSSSDPSDMLSTDLSTAEWDQVTRHADVWHVGCRGGKLLGGGGSEGREPRFALFSTVVAARDCLTTRAYTEDTTLFIPHEVAPAPWPQETFTMSGEPASCYATCRERAGRKRPPAGDGMIGVCCGGSLGVGLLFEALVRLRYKEVWLLGEGSLTLKWDALSAYAVFNGLVPRRIGGCASQTCCLHDQIIIGAA